ncbi:MAG: hypothetical protein HOW73_24370 [Polyangiaceae bacterium]|nr:hypothetical protein [Polyangiaceae bacterium]
MAPPGKKHLLLHVPDHQPLSSGSGDGTESYSTFLRLGTPDPNPPFKALLEEIVGDGFIDDDRERGTNDVAGTQATIEGAGGAAGMGHKLTKAQREAETARFLGKGGWHDHTQGNRVSTTQGDKIEIVRGNFKMVVLGRQDELKNAHSVDSSGGLKQEADISPGSITEIRWVQDPYSGTWRVTEMTEKGDVHEIYHGNKKEEFYGNSVESIIGSATEADNPDSGLVPKTKKTNPTITERTWAASIHSYTGSSDKYVPTIYEETYATNIEEKTFANTVKEETRATTIESRTKGRATIKDYVGEASEKVVRVEEEVYADHHQSMTVANNQIDLQFLGAHTGVLIAGVMTDIEISTLRVEVKAGLAFLEIEAGALYTEVFIGVKAEFSLAKKAKFESATYTTALASQNIVATDTKLTVMKKTLAAAWSATTFKASIGLGAD